MATPYVSHSLIAMSISMPNYYEQIAGVAALYFSTNGGRTSIADAGNTAHHLITSSGNPVAHHDGSGSLA